MRLGSELLILIFRFAVTMWVKAHEQGILGTLDLVRASRRSLRKRKIF